MKNAFKVIVTFLIVSSTLSACKKKTDNPMDFTIDAQNLTACTEGNCLFEYVNYAAMADQQTALTTGQYRIFLATKSNNFSTTRIYMQAPMQGDKFLLTDNDILAGKVKYLFSCASCDYFNLIPIAGTVKGIKVTNINSSAEKWLLDAHIVLAAEKAKKPVDTIHIKQYFNLALK
jgi:predicted small lipoprotein YifL